jgi:hypothetical protein
MAEVSLAYSSSGRGKNRLFAEDLNLEPSGYRFKSWPRRILDGLIE